MTHPIQRSPASSSPGSLPEVPELAAAAPEPALRPARLGAQATHGGAPQRRSIPRAVAGASADQLDLDSQVQADADAQALSAGEHERSSRRRPREEPSAGIEGHLFFGDDTRRQVARREGMESAAEHGPDEVQPSALSLADLPAGALQLVADAISAYDLAMGLGTLDNANIQEHLGLHIRAARIAVLETPQVTTLQQFDALLGMQDLPGNVAQAWRNVQVPPSLQAEVLAALGGRILALPRADQARALRSFFAFPPLGVSNRVLDELRLVEARAIASPDSALGALNHRENRLVRRDGAARAAVDNGEGVQEVARRYAISANSNMNLLEREPSSLVLHAVCHGEGTVAELAARHGITRDAVLRRLQMRAVKRVADNFIRRGETRGSVITRLGISDPAALAEINRICAADAVKREGMTVSAAAEAFGLSSHDRRHLADSIQVWVAYTAVREGKKNLIAVAERFGINMPRHIAELERHALDNARSAIQAGRSLPGTAARLGIRGTTHIVSLANAAPMTSFEQFSALLGTPPAPEDLPPAVLAEAMAAIGVRIMGLPTDDREQAVQAFVAFGHPGVAHPLLDELWQASSQGGAAALHARELQLVGTGGAARAEVNRKSNISTISAKYGVWGTEAIGILESSWFPHAVQCLREHDCGVQYVASMGGITREQARSDLEVRVALDVGIPRLVRGGSVARVVRTLGISDPQALHILNDYAAQPDVPQAP